MEVPLITQVQAGTGSTISWEVSRRARLVERVAVILIALFVLAWSQIHYVRAWRAQSLGYYPERVFTGLSPTYTEDATSYLMWMRQASDGHFLFVDLYTPEEHPRIYVNVFFWALGTVVRATGLSIIAVYGLARVVLGAFLMGLLYMLACRSFRVPGQRVACFLALLLAGGWEGAAGFLERNFEWAHVSSPGWWVPEMSTFFSLMLFPHFIAGFTLMIGCALMMDRAWAPDTPFRRGIRYSIPTGLLLSILTFFHPYDTLSMLGAIWTAAVLLGLPDRRWPFREVQQALVATAVWIPSLAYNLFVFQHPVFRAFGLQSRMRTPEADRLAIALGIGGILAVIALLAYRRLARVHLLMAGWLLSCLLIIHLPLRFQRRMIGGIQFPLAVLATAAIVVVLVPWLMRRMRPQATGERLGWGTLAIAVILLPLQTATPYYLMEIEWQRLREHTYPSWLRVEQRSALAELERLQPSESIVFASYDLGNFVPPLSGHRCYLGHYALTLDFKVKKADVERFYAGGDEDDGWRRQLMKDWSVAWVLHTEAERALGDFDPRSRPWLREIYRSGSDPEHSAAIYEVHLESP